jgi:putative addiction module component (TIGR02574 family)
MTKEFESLLKLDRAERIQLVEDLWDSIAREEGGDLPVPEWKREELRRRKKHLQENPESARTWEEIKRHARGGD